jgi:hypothetical protein
MGISLSHNGWVKDILGHWEHAQVGHARLAA